MGKTEREREKAGRRRGRYARHRLGLTIGSIKSAKERWLALLAARKGEVERNRGRKGSRYNSQWARRTGAKIKRHPNGNYRRP